MRKIILASTSPRRREILELLGIDFEVVDSGYNEELIKTDDPVELVEELALQKALAVAQKYPDAIIVGGDTTVTFGSGWIGKAESADEAKEMFGKLLGRTHKVVTGVAVVDSLTGDKYVGSEEGIVTLREGTKDELEKYVENEKNWRGFAGAYALQGGAAPFLLEQTGKLSAIIGMPIELTIALLEQAGVIIDENGDELEQAVKGKKIGI